jgi:hypothetical protein
VTVNSNNIGYIYIPLVTNSIRNWIWDSFRTLVGYICISYSRLWIYDAVTNNKVWIVCDMWMDKLFIQYVKTVECRHRQRWDQALPHSVVNQYTVEGLG